MPLSDTSSIRSGTTALLRRYNEELVEGHSLCPWAGPARIEESSWIDVVSLKVMDSAALAAALRSPIDGADLSGKGHGGVLQVAFPFVDVSARAWERLTADSGREFGAELALAAFHPEYEFRVDREGAAVRALRRTPCPCVQVIARDALPAGEAQRYLPASEVAHFVQSTAGTSKTRLTATERIRAENLRLLQSGAADTIRRLQDELIASQAELLGRTLPRRLPE